MIPKKADLDYCCNNDQYGLYQLADEGKLIHLAGFDEEYDVPEEDIIIDEEKKEK